MPALESMLSALPAGTPLALARGLACIPEASDQSSVPELWIVMVDG